MASEDLIREAQDPSTSAARLAELAQVDRGLWPAIVVHPAAYPGLLDWLGQQGDATVNAVLALRSGSAATPTPTEVIPTISPAATEQPTAQQPAAEPVAETPVAEPVAETPVAETPVAETPVASPVAEPVAQPVTETQPIQPVEPAQPQPVQPVYPTVEAPAAAAPVAAAAAAPTYGAVPPTGEQPAALATPGGEGGDGSKKNFWVLAGMVAVVLVLIGGAAFGATKVFGGDDDGDKDEASSSQTTDAEDEPSDLPTEEPTEDVPDLGSGSGSEFCDEFQDLQTETLDSMGDIGAGSDLGELSDSLGKLASAYDDLEGKAPSEIKSEVGVMAEYFDTFKDPTKVDPSDISGKITEFSDAAQKVSQYYVSSCL
ncbi:hypothetical protein [Aeromicrobium stalagmiti]|uniref:variant leucine-rich repeat-containing protein n=1 Tax=Aeromicrobium stalagmiti TaxID=2738988 RepID=UPI0015693261|nr:hypothetical protein [Aeromicrobium stalagmiti]NRQ51266.1 hypothetical protein [Aeromicrobium stalagmiti]